MQAYRTTLIAAALGIAALASGPASANLIVSCTSSTDSSWCTSGFGTDQPGNGFLSYSAAAGPFQVTELVSGEDFIGLPNVMEVHNFEINVTAPGQLSVFVSQTNMRGAGVAEFGLDFGTSQIVGDLSHIVRTLWLDYGTANQQNLGSCSEDLGCNGLITHSAGFDVSGGYSLTEEFDMVAGSGCVSGNACELSTDDKFSVPEPLSLSLFGSGLLAFSAMRRRRRKAAKSA